MSETPSGPARAADAGKVDGATNVLVQSQCPTNGAAGTGGNVPTGISIIGGGGTTGATDGGTPGTGNNGSEPCVFNGGGVGGVGGGIRRGTGAGSGGSGGAGTGGAIPGKGTPGI